MKTTNQFKLGLKCKYFMSKSSMRRIPNKEGCKSGEMISTSQHTSHHHIKVEFKKKIKKSWISVLSMRPLPIKNIEQRQRDRYKILIKKERKKKGWGKRELEKERKRKKKERKQERMK